MDRHDHEKNAEPDYRKGYGDKEAVNFPGVSREPTIGEAIDRKLDEHRLQLKRLQDLRDNLPQTYLSAAVSRFPSFVQI